jgi:hypothetical protein
MNETTNEKPVKVCLECGEPLGPGREDRKFCNDTCRTAFNNKRRKEPIPEATYKHDDSDWRPSFYQKINNIISRNRDILEYLCEIDYRAIEKHDLDGYGFNFKYFSSEYHDLQDGTYRFCYDHGYQVFNDRLVQIIVRTEQIIC